jgi:transcriptional regulator of heat shock response
MKTQFSDRKKEIFKIIIEDYFSRAQPIGSKHVAERQNDKFSPATIRNEMASLEEEGYIEQPHTSAGRIPTDKGYRYYVDNLMRSRGLNHKEEEAIKKVSGQTQEDIEMFAHHMIEVASTLTQLAAAIIIEDGQKRQRVYHFGIGNIASQPEFKSIERLSRIIKAFEQDDLLSSVLREYSLEKGITITIGSENRYKEIRECSVVVCPCMVKGEEVGSIGIIGPTRMSYGKVASILASVVKEVSSIFGSLRRR